LINLVVLLLACILRVNFSAFILGVVVFSAIGYLLDPVSAELGEYLLTLPSLTDTWTQLYQNDWMRISSFNNTVAMGGFVISVLLLVPVTLVSRILILQYRKRVLNWVNRLKIVQALKATKFWSIYSKFSEYS
jgi:uncharacterized protein (TIGR03546 family)